MMHPTPPLSLFDTLLAELPRDELDALLVDVPDLDAVLAACPPFNFDELLADLDASTTRALSHPASARERVVAVLRRAGRGVACSR